MPSIDEVFRKRTIRLTFTRRGEVWGGARSASPQSDKPFPRKPTD